MAAVFHPDKARFDKSLDAVYASQIWQQLNDAKEQLFDDVKRKFYDIRIGVVKPSTNEIFELGHMRREQSETELQNMRASVEAKRALEAERDGLIIVKARYGALQTPGDYIDVTDQLQNLVDQGCLIYKGNKDFMEGVWDATFMRGADKEMQITYLFQGLVHEVTLAAEEDIILPLGEHALSEEELEARNAALASKEARRQKRANIKSAFVTALVVGFVGLYVKGLFPQPQLESDLLPAQRKTLKI